MITVPIQRQSKRVLNKKETYYLIIFVVIKKMPLQETVDSTMLAIRPNNMYMTNNGR